MNDDWMTTLEIAHWLQMSRTSVYYYADIYGIERKVLSAKGNGNFQPRTFWRKADFISIKRMRDELAAQIKPTKSNEWMTAREYANRFNVKPTEPTEPTEPMEPAERKLILSKKHENVFQQIKKGTIPPSALLLVKQYGFTPYAAGEIIRRATGTQP